LKYWLRKGTKACNYAIRKTPRQKTRLVSPEKFKIIGEKNKVKTSAVANRTQSMFKSERRFVETYSNNEAEEKPPSKSAISGNLEEEPPSKSAISGSLEEEPPSKTVTNRHRFFGYIPDSIWNDWKWQFRNRINTVNELTKFIPLSAEEQAQLKLVINRYPLSVTPYYLSLINPDDPDDPIRKQAIPSILEITMGATSIEDPLEEKRDSVVPGLIHRYPDRVLMVLTNICPILCRHCTRKREWRSGGWVHTPSEIEAMLDYIRHHNAIRDVIISGGDPLTLSTRHLEDIISRIRAIRHVEIIRIGTRFPVVLPQRIDDKLCLMLSRYGPIWLNTHFNHVREITPEAADACDRLVRSGVPVNNQSVLLCSVNDSVQAQMELCRALLRIKVRPYYLFQCDQVQGTDHLRTPVEVGIKIIEGMRGHTSGLAVPTFVIDLPQGGGKVSLQPNYVLIHTEEELVLRNYQDRIFHYRNPGSQSPQELPAYTEFKFEPGGARDADRVIIRS
jgi:lysine 2,3-aminomutase